MCTWAADSSKLLRPLSRVMVLGVDSTPFADVDSWLLGLRAWLEIDDTLQVLTLAASRTDKTVTRRQTHARSGGKYRARSTLGVISVLVSLCLHEA